ncbi:hypothetical protein BD414DRAFT_489268 [Trametes punicea]|nr:hypothetical protein BD414DRAFT_489268 [Trametes punicea]
MQSGSRPFSSVPILRLFSLRLLTSISSTSSSSSSSGPGPLHPAPRALLANILFITSSAPWRLDLTPAHLDVTCARHSSMARFSTSHWPPPLLPPEPARHPTLLRQSRHSVLLSLSFLPSSSHRAFSPHPAIAHPRGARPCLPSQPHPFLGGSVSSWLIGLGLLSPPAALSCLCPPVLRVFLASADRTILWLCSPEPPLRFSRSALEAILAGPLSSQLVPHGSNCTLSCLPQAPAVPPSNPPLHARYGSAFSPLRYYPPFDDHAAQCLPTRLLR